MLVGNCSRLAICLDTGVDYEFTLTPLNTEDR